MEDVPVGTFLSFYHINANQTDHVLGKYLEKMFLILFAVKCT